MKRNGDAVERHGPISWSQRRHNFQPAAAATPVHSSRVFDRDVENAILRPLRNELDETVLKTLE
jgi:hypothetical protein